MPARRRSKSRVLVIGDTHCPGMLDSYPAFLKSVWKEFKCNHVVHIGDLVDNAAIHYHEHDPDRPGPADEFAAAQRQVQKLYRLFPRADWLVGNHDALNMRKAFTAGLPEIFMRPMNEVWNVPGWKVHPRYSRLTIDNVIYAHGDIGQGGMYNAVKNGRANMTSWVCGHVHSEGGVWYTQTEGRVIFGLSTGCGVDSDNLAFKYGRRYTRKPVIGCGVVLEGRQAHWIAAGG